MQEQAAWKVVFSNTYTVSLPGEYLTQGTLCGSDLECTPPDFGHPQQLKRRTESTPKSSGRWTPVVCKASASPHSLLL